jgi:hypothetical protein
MLLSIAVVLWCLRLLWDKPFFDDLRIDAFDFSTTPIITIKEAQPRCRLFVGIPKSGTTWVMNLLYVYLLLATGARDLEPATLSFANDHVKRAEYSCQYEWGEKQRSSVPMPERERLAYRLLPAFSHILRNADTRGDASRPLNDETDHFLRFFGLKRDEKTKLPHRNHTSSN